MDQDGTGPQGQSNYTQGMGYTPLLWFKSFAIEERYIKLLRLYHVGIVPKIKVVFEDNKEILKGEATPTNDDTFDLFLNSTSENLKSIHASFKIEKFLQGPNEPDQKYIIEGILNVPDLYVENNNTYKGTSFEVLRKICTEMGLGFNSNITNTNDDMSWLNINSNPNDFIKSIISRSYISDDTFTAGYIDYYYCFNYIDVEKELNRDISKDVGIDTSGLSEQSIKDETERIKPLILTTDKSQSSSSNYISKYVKINNSSKKSLKNGYSTITKTYDRINKQFLVFEVDSLTSDGSESIILKGAQNDNKYKNENVKHDFIGKLDTDNTHQNFNYAVTQNEINLNKLSNITIDVDLPNANWNLYKFQKINVQIVNESSTITNPDIIDRRYSGDYIIEDIEYIWDGNAMSQKVRLIRRELGKTPEEIKNSPPFESVEEEKEINFNPIVGTTSVISPAPNSVYNIGEVYLVQDVEGNRYELNITEILPNGIEVNGVLKKL
jgi:hypothetical protein